MSLQIAKRQFNVTEYYRMAETGILSEHDRVELIEGEIIKMSPIGSRRAACVKRINLILVQQAGSIGLVSVQDPIRLDDYSEPEPDVALLKPRRDFYAQAHPAPADVLLVVEVADTSVEYDREVKMPLYARAEIPEMWLIDLPIETIEVYSEPVGETYRDVRRYRRSESFTSKTFPALALAVDDILG